MRFPVTMSVRVLVVPILARSPTSGPRLSTAVAVVSPPPQGFILWYWVAEFPTYTTVGRVAPYGWFTVRVSAEVVPRGALMRIPGTMSVRVLPVPILALSPTPGKHLSTAVVLVSPTP
jgi:hypothetical protein